MICSVCGEEAYRDYVEVRSADKTRVWEVCSKHKVKIIEDDFIIVRTGLPFFGKYEKLR